eukprot:4403427-Ditylum_brightwellii.AAC.1
MLEVDLSSKLKVQYPEVEEEIDKKILKSLFGKLAITAYVDSRTHVMYLSKQQGAVETSIYGAKFMTMKTAVEEVMAMRYMLWYLGVKVLQPTRILDDNWSVIINSTVASSLLRKKHVAISYHLAWEATASKIAQPLKTK